MLQSVNGNTPRKLLLTSGMTLICLAVMGLLIGSRSAASTVQRAAETVVANGCPPVAKTLNFAIVWGSATLDNSTVPVGSVVTARSPRGDIVGCEEVETPGTHTMFIYGEDAEFSIPGMRDQETVSFQIDGAPAASAPNFVWESGYDPHQVNLSAFSPPPPVANLGISQDANGIALEWADTGAEVDHYEVWYSPDPYAAPNQTGTALVSDTIGRPSSGSIVTFYFVPQTELGYYIVIGVDTHGGYSEVTSQVGRFPFGLVPGGP